MAMKRGYAAAIVLCLVAAGCGRKEVMESEAEIAYMGKLDYYLHAQMAMQMYIEGVGSALDRGDYASARKAQRDAERNWKVLTEAASDLDIEVSQWIPQQPDTQRDDFRPYPR